MTDEEKALNTKLWYFFLTGQGWHNNRKEGWKDGDKEDRSIVRG